MRAELGLPRTAPVVLSVGVLRPQKALEVLVDAAAVLRDEFPDVRVLIAGAGPEEGPLRTRIAELGLTDTVLLLGNRRDVPDLLALADVCVSSSDFEGSPLAVMEYMAAAKPVVATRVGGVPDLIENGVHGYVVPPATRRRSPGWAELLRSPSCARRARRERAGQAARRVRARRDGAPRRGALPGADRELEEAHDLVELERRSYSGGPPRGRAGRAARGAPARG